VGDGTTTVRATPVAVNGMRDASAVVVGSAHACASLRGGAVS
jgi:hypothetical protein